MCWWREKVGVAEVVEGAQFVNTTARKQVIYKACGGEGAGPHVLKKGLN